jgi:hypothetical protein
VPSALLALGACGLVLWAALTRHWWYGTGPAASELPTLIEGCAAAIIAVTTHSPFGEPERATPRWLPALRLGTALLLCGAAIGLLAAGAAVAYDPKAGVALAGGILPVARNVLGFTGALIAGYSEPLTWATRPPADRGGWIAAVAVFALGLAALTLRGPRVRPSGE